MVQANQTADAADAYLLRAQYYRIFYKFTRCLMEKGAARDRAAAAVEASALALAAAWAALVALEQARERQAELRLSESGRDLALLQRLLLPRALAALLVCGCAAVGWALAGPQRLPAALRRRSR